MEVDGGDGKMCLQITRWWSRAILRLWNRHQSYLVECTKLGSQIDIRRKYPISAVLFHELATHTPMRCIGCSAQTQIYIKIGLYMFGYMEINVNIIPISSPRK